MFRRISTLFLLLVSLAAVSVFAAAETTKTITLRMIDAKTGQLIKTSNYLVQTDHQDTVHADWVEQNKDGTGTLKVPTSAKLLIVHASYDDAMHLYINCDSALEKKDPVDHWYEISEILSTGIVAPNGCVKPKVAAKEKQTAKPGEFIFYVRQKNMLETWQDQ